MVRHMWFSFICHDEQKSLTFFMLSCLVGRDAVKVLDLDMPERLGDNLFIQEITEIDSEDGKYSLDKLKISLYHVIDMKDYKKYSLMAVCEPSALLITMPSIPDFFHSKHKKLAKLNRERCKRTERITSKQMTAIEKDPPRLTRSFLVVLPEGMVVTNDFGKDPMLPTQDMKVGYALRTFIDTDILGSKKKETKQQFNYIFWTLRIISSDDNELEHSEDSASEDSLAALFAGQATIGDDDNEEGDNTTWGSNSMEQDQGS